VEERNAGTSGLAAGRVRVQGLGLRFGLPEFEDLPLLTTLERGWATCRLGGGGRVEGRRGTAAATPPTGVSGWITGGLGRAEERKGEILPRGQQHERWMVTMRGPNGLTRGGERPPETVVEGGVGASTRDQERKLPQGRSEASVMGLMGRHNGCFYNCDAPDF
jgi:hypothetical protein